MLLHRRLDIAGQMLKLRDDGVIKPYHRAQVDCILAKYCDECKDGEGWDRGQLIVYAQECIDICRKIMDREGLATQSRGAQPYEDLIWEAMEAMHDQIDRHRALIPHWQRDEVEEDFIGEEGRRELSVYDPYGDEDFDEEEDEDEDDYDDMEDGDYHDEVESSRSEAVEGEYDSLEIDEEDQQVVDENTGNKAIYLKSFTPSTDPTALEHRITIANGYEVHSMPDDSTTFEADVEVKEAKLLLVFLKLVKHNCQEGERLLRYYAMANGIPGHVLEEEMERVLHQQGVSKPKLLEELSIRTFLLAQAQMSAC